MAATVMIVMASIRIPRNIWGTRHMTKDSLNPGSIRFSEPALGWLVCADFIPGLTARLNWLIS
jgi:hypothetical protein